MFQAWHGNLFQYSSLKATHWKTMVRRLGLNPAVQIKEHFLSIKFKTNGCQSTEVGVTQKQNTRSDYRPTVYSYYRSQDSPLHALAAVSTVF